MLVIVFGIILQFGLSNCNLSTSGDLSTSVSEACDVNDTTCGTLSSTTAIPPQSMSFNADLNVHQKNFDICTCDLHRQFCDINCCCDKECSLEDKKVFARCYSEPDFSRDTSFCKYTDYIYVNNTPYEWEVNRNGFFCIAKTNLPPKYTLQNHQRISSFEESQIQKRYGYMWSDMETKETVMQLPNVSYIYGSDIWMLKNRSLKIFELPKSFITRSCLAKEKAKYLKDFSNECSVTNVNSENSHLQALTYYGNISFIRSPQLVVNGNAQELQRCPENACVELEVQDCGVGNNCTILNHSKSALCTDNVQTNERICRNLVSKVRYNFYHNGSQGFTRIKLFLSFKNISFFLHDLDFEFKQIFEVRFLWHNATLNYSQLLSGNPGYITGKPLLLGNLRNGTLIRNPKLVYDNFMAFPISREGICILNNEMYVLSEFKYNMMLKCKLQKQMSKGNFSAGDLCKNVQKMIFSYWPISTNRSVEKIVGVFGNSNESREADWVKVVWNNTSDDILSTVLGNFSEGNRTIICRNIITTLKIEVFYAQVDVGKLLRQGKIVAVAFVYGPERLYEFSIEDSIYLNVVIREQIIYFDVTTERVEKYAQPPVFQIRLPSDFFYPFVKVGNSASVFYISYATKFFMCFLVIHITLLDTTYNYKLLY